MAGIVIFPQTAYPAQTTINQVLYSSAANVITGLATANNAVLVTNGSGVPAMTTAGVGQMARLGLGAAADGTIPLLISGTSQLFKSAGATTQAQYFGLTNTTGNLVLGIESSAGGVLTANTLAYSTCLVNSGNTAALHIGAAATITIATTGFVGIGPSGLATSPNFLLNLVNTSASGVVTAFGIENTSTGANTTKGVEIEWDGRNTLNTRKRVGAIQVLPPVDGDFNNSSMNLIVRGADADVNAVTIVGITGSSRVGINNTSPAPSAVLDLTSTVGALIVPRMTTAQRNALTAVNGMIIYNTTVPEMEGYVNGSWITL